MLNVNPAAFLCTGTRQLHHPVTQIFVSLMYSDTTIKAIQQKLVVGFINLNILLFRKHVNFNKQSYYQTFNYLAAAEVSGMVISLYAIPIR